MRVHESASSLPVISHVSAFFVVFVDALAVTKTHHVLYKERKEDRRKTRTNPSKCIFEYVLELGGGGSIGRFL